VCRWERPWCSLHRIGKVEISNMAALGLTSVLSGPLNRNDRWTVTDLARFTAEAELYDPNTGTWSFTSNLNTPRAYHTAALLPDGNALLAGGLDGSSISGLKSVELGKFAAVPPRIIMASVSGKQLIIAGENFDDGAAILINGEKQKTRNDDQNPQTTLIGKKAGKRVKPGDRVQVRNPDGTISEAFTFTSK
jgi:hypothetical protein